jgi:hypothetical protein
MADKTDITVSVMPKVEEKIVELSGKLERIMAERAPEAWDAALAVVQVGAIRNLVVGLIAIVIAIIAWTVFARLYRKWRELDGPWAVYRAEYHNYMNSSANRPDKPTAGKGGFEASVAAGFFVIGLLSTLSAVANLLSVWTWVALFRPELVIAKRILDGVL